MNNLLTSKSNTHSQNGEDGIIAAIFAEIGTTTRACCEFGAWDGIFLSNCRNLILQGWQALMIEGDTERYQSLIRNYQDNPKVIGVNCFVDAAENNLGAIMAKHQVPDLDFLSVDIDGLDYEILETLDVRPRVICVEANAGHHPSAATRLDRSVSMHNVGQPLKLFVHLAERMGYDLVCYNGNAFFVLREIREKSNLPKLTPEDAYPLYLDALTPKEKEWLYLVNLGLVNPHYRYGNSLLEREALGITAPMAFVLRLSTTHPFVRRVIYKLRLMCGGQP